MTNRGKSVANFGPELVHLFRVGFQQEVSLKFDTLNEAFSLQHRMNKLRQAMRKEDHPMLAIAEGVTVGIERETKTVHVRPADAKFSAKIREVLGFSEDAELTDEFLQRERDAVAEYHRQHQQEVGGAPAGVTNGETPKKPQNLEQEALMRRYLEGEKEEDNSSEE